MAVSKVRASSSNFPPSSLEWEVTLDEDVPALVLLYNNLMYDIIGLALGKLGVEYSKLLAGEQTRDEFDCCCDEIKKSLA
jgi:hypothetical protein